MNSLTQINAILDDHFASEFNEEYISNYETKDDAISDFEGDLECYYNSETDYIDLGEIKQLCNFNKVMKICEFVAEKYEEYDMTIEKSHFEDNDKILKAYIYFYMEETHRHEFLCKIEQYNFEEEEEPEPEQ
jgi:hypothetical protein